MCVFCCLGVGAVTAQTAKNKIHPRPDSKKKHAPPPKQQKMKHATAQSEGVFYLLLFGRRAPFFCCWGGEGEFTHLLACLAWC